MATKRSLPAISTLTDLQFGRMAALVETRFASLLDGENATTTGLIVTLLAAMLWGAAHALSPGHGKTIVGAYLVGSRGTPRHAAFLGLTVTITHTAGVIALGLITIRVKLHPAGTALSWISVVRIDCHRSWPLDTKGEAARKQRYGSPSSRSHART